MTMNNIQDVGSKMDPGCWGRICPIAHQLFEGHEKEFKEGTYCSGSKKARKDGPISLFFICL